MDTIEFGRRAAIGKRMQSAITLGALVPVWLLLVGAQAPDALPDPYPDDWSQRDLSDFGDTDDWDKTRAICAAVSGASPPEGDLPRPEDRVALTGCNSAELYYGIGMPADPVAARKCAFLEVERSKTEAAQSFATPFEFHEAHGMLAIVYANGTGAGRNLDFAIHAACQLDDAPRAMVFRIEHLDRLRRDGPDADAFSTCDDITSGISAGICSDLAARIAEQDRAKELAAWTAGWPASQRDAFADAFASFEAYASVSNEMNCFRGTLAAACSIEGAERDIAIFLARLRSLVERRPLPPVEPAEEGDVMRGDWDRPAVMTKAEFDGHMAYRDADTREWYAANRKEAIAARRLFEPKLIAFLKLARPELSSHEVRVLFRDL